MNYGPLGQGSGIVHAGSLEWSCNALNRVGALLMLSLTPALAVSMVAVKKAYCYRDSQWGLSCEVLDIKCSSAIFSRCP